MNLQREDFKILKQIKSDRKIRRLEKTICSEGLKRVSCHLDVGTHLLLSDIQDQVCLN